VILLKLEKFFRSKDIACSIEKDRIHFIYDAFQCIEFKIKLQKTWSLAFFKPNFSGKERLRFYDVALSIRFPKWLIHNVYHVSTPVCMCESRCWGSRRRGNC